MWRQYGSRCGSRSAGRRGTSAHGAYGYGVVAVANKTRPPTEAAKREPPGAVQVSLLKTRFERIDDGARQGSDAQQRLRTARRRTKGGHFPARMGSATASGGHLEMFLSERNFRPMARREFLDQSRVPRCVTAGRTLERRHCLAGLHQHRVEVTAASALPSDLHRQLDDRRGDLRQCLNALCPEFRFGHGGLSRFGFERCHGSSGAVRTVCVLAGAALVQSPVVRA